ncbi:MAG: hypothetical protein HQK52_12755 [Oligoflexia bacterium]|nr:hypothetical protein [Oligoflexia bacterium]
MFDDLFGLASNYKEMFSDTVRDQFGQSIISEVFDPVLQDISCLQQLGNFFNSRVVDIDQLLCEIRSIV